MSDVPSSSSSTTRGWMVALVVVGVIAYGIGVNSAASRASQATLAGSNPTSTTVLGIGGKPPAGTVASADFQQFWDLWTLLQQKYYKKPLDEKKMLYGAMQGLAASTGDPYTLFFEPQLAQEFNDQLQGKFDGIGAEIGMKDGQLQIVAPLPETPADKAGLLAGDAILAINASSTDSMPVDQAVSLIRGVKGTTVKLNIGRISTTKGADGKPKQTVKQFDVTLTRDTIVVKSVKTSWPKPGIAEIQITSFDASAGKEFAKAVDEVLAKDPKGLILDLRNDPGGFLDQATAVAGEWLGDGLVVSERRQGEIVDEYHGTGDSRLKDMPTIVLVNGGSASASEIVAGALQDDGMAKLVGTKTFGKGSVQEYSDLKDGTAVKITVAEWLTPKGRFINTIGIEPNVTVDRTEDDYHANRDPQLDKALELLTGASSTAATPASGASKTP